MDIAVVGTSGKENEKRVAIHPEHIGILSDAVRKRLFFEKGYGVPFGFSDEDIRTLTGNPLIERSDLFRDFKVIIITKPVLADFEQMREGTLVFGWIHSVQQSDITQIAIDRKLTLIAWENMHYQGNRDRVHLFNKNNEMAGYCGVQHALRLRGIDGNFGPPRKVVVLSLGSVSRGAILALRGHGFSDITVCTRRPAHLVKNKVPGIKYLQIIQESGSFIVSNYKRETRPMIELFLNADIIVNGILQNPNKPVVFIDEATARKFRKECLLIDISCDRGMSFSFAQPTSFSDPVLRIGKILYYAVDHTPTLLWDSASWEISNCVIQYLPYLVKNQRSKTLENATDILEGRILNKDILSYQNRAKEYPYPIRQSE